MPFTKHIIDPINISECPLPFGEPNELECLSNLTLANVIRQLSSLGQHANRIFDELIQDATRINNRSLILNQRIDNLRSKISQLDLQNEDVQKDDLKMKKQFKSSVKIDQQVVSRRTMPDSIRILYNNADPPPALDKLNAYRTDKKDCMKFYTDPEFFFNIWCNELMKDNETRKNEKKKRKTRGEKSNGKSPLNDNQKQYADPARLEAQRLNEAERLKNNSLLMNQMAKDPVNMAAAAANYQMRQQQQQQQQLLQIKQQHQIYAQHNNLNPNQSGVDLNQLQKSNNMIPGGNNLNELTDQSFLPPPPSHLLQSSVHSLQNFNANSSNNNNHNYEIYTESNDYNNGDRTSKFSIQQASLVKQTMPQERPSLPPPPIPENNFSDLQQIQQQIIRKFDGIVTIGSRNEFNGNSTITNDLPPPPSPPILDSNEPYAGHANKINHKPVVLETNLAEAGDTFPLPPPPELPSMSPPSSNANNHHMNLPLPPPLPPLVEPDTTSSSNSSPFASTNNNQNDSKMNNSELGVAASGVGGAGQTQQQASSSRSFLDDINKGRFVLKPTQKDNLENRKKVTSAGGSSSLGQGDEANRDTIQPFVNNSDVAAIIDFVRKFRTHVQDSSDDSENSDWDE